VDGSNLVTVTGMLAACGPGECCLPNSASGHDEVGKARQNGSRLGVDDLRQTLDGGGGAVPGSFQERLHALLNGTGGEGIFQARSELLNAGGEVIEFTKEFQLFWLVALLG